MALFGHSSAAWHTARMVMGLLSCLALVAAFRRMTASLLGTLFFFAWLAFQIESTEIWFRLGPGETLALLFLSLAAFALVVASQKPKPGWWDYAALAAMALMALSKETFVLVIPAFLLIRLILERRRIQAGWIETIRGIARPLLAGSVLFAAQLAIIFCV
ncbi:MAG: hypothetical protein GY953_31640 [bacterium]|nr:hypothetical protein [bacterium]